MIGPHFGNMPTLVENYLPKPAIDRITIRQTELLRNRGWEPSSHKDEEDEDDLTDLQDFIPDNRDGGERCPR